jgi:hypothetical protein
MMFWWLKYFSVFGVWLNHVSEKFWILNFKLVLSAFKLFLYADVKNKF